MRHLYKYLLAPLPKPRQFRFCDADGFAGQSAASLREFSQRLATAPLESLAYHLARGDFERWLAEVLCEPDLAHRLRRFAHRNVPGDELRRARADTVAERFEELESLV